jgi:hypothetical protein
MLKHFCLRMNIYNLTNLSRVKTFARYLFCFRSPRNKPQIATFNLDRNKQTINLQSFIVHNNASIYIGRKMGNKKLDNTDCYVIKVYIGRKSIILIY